MEGEILGVVQPNKKHSDLYTAVYVAKGIFHSSITARSERDRSVFNNGTTARLLQLTAMLPMVSNTVHCPQ